MNVTKLLEGKKTYVVSAIMLIHALSGWILGEKVDWNQVLVAAGIASLRGGIAKAGPLAVLACLPFCTGCAGFKVFTGTQVNPALIEFVASRAGDAARIGVALDLQTHPEHRVAYAAAVIALDGLLQRQDYTSADFQAVLACLPVKEFQGDSGALVLQGTVMVFDLFTMFGYDVNSTPALKSVMTRVREGINLALAGPVIKTRAITGPEDVPGRALVPTRVKRI